MADTSMFDYDPESLNMSNAGNDIANISISYNNNDVSMENINSTDDSIVFLDQLPSGDIIMTNSNSIRNSIKSKSKEYIKTSNNDIPMPHAMHLSNDDENYDIEMKVADSTTDETMSSMSDISFHIDTSDVSMEESKTPIPTNPIKYHRYAAKDLPHNNYYSEYMILLNKNIQPDDFNIINGAQLLLEESWIAHQTCKAVYPADSYNKILLHLFQILPAKIKNIIKNDTPVIFGENFNREIGCLVDMIVRDRSYNTQKTSINMNKRIRRWISKIQPIGAASLEGYAFNTYINNEDFLVMKASRDPNSKDLIHEAAIGMLALNNLRKVIPNFMFVYSFYKCSPPYLDKYNNKFEVVTWCDNNNNNSMYLVTEKIDGITIGEFIRKADLISAMQVFLLTFNALHLANVLYKYTHNDLHLGNVIVRILDNEILVPYYMYDFDISNPKPSGYILTRYIPVIIDYGFSQMMLDVDGNKIPLSKWDTYLFKVGGINPISPYPLYDVYRLIIAASLQAYDAKNEAVLSLINIFYLQFNETYNGKRLSIVDKIKLRGKKTTSSQDVLINRSYENISISKYMDAIFSTNVGIQQIANDFYVTDIDIIKKYPRTDDNNIQYPNFGKLFENIIDMKEPPRNVLDFCDAYSSVDMIIKDKKHKNDIFVWLKANFDLDRDITLNYVTVGRELNKIVNTLNKIKLPDLSTYNIDINPSAIKSSTAVLDPLHKQFVEQYYKLLRILLILSEDLHEVSTWLLSTTCAIEIKGVFDSNLLTIVSKMRSDLEVATKLYKLRVKRVVLNDLVVKKRILEKMQYHTSNNLKYREIANFYITMHNLIVKAL